ncbi:MAG TPA: hypothetical protein VGX23_09060 [Actinocrinis sp.]|nr:hypothetical protein [Actinocrinis sp.]
MAGRTGPAHPQLVALVRRAGWLTAGLGVVLLVLGWYGVSGQATVAQQVPYLASASIPGAALVIGGLVLAGAERVRGRSGGAGGSEAGQGESGQRSGSGTGPAGVVDEATVRRIAELHGLLVEPAADGEPKT